MAWDTHEAITWSAETYVRNNINNVVTEYPPHSTRLNIYSHNSSTMNPYDENTDSIRSSNDVR